MDWAFWGLVLVVILAVLGPRLLAARHRIRGEDARRRVSQGALLVDVRSEPEFEGHHLEGAINIPLETLVVRILELSAESPVVVYCQSGMRSASAARMLAREGFEVYDLGPISAW